MMRSPLSIDVTEFLVLSAGFKTIVHMYRESPFDIPCHEILRVEAAVTSTGHGRGAAHDGPSTFRLLWARCIVERARYVFPLSRPRHPCGSASISNTTTSVDRRKHGNQN